MKTKVIALGDSWFHYPNNMDIDGKIIGIRNKIARIFGANGRQGVGNILKYLVETHKVPLRYGEKTITQLFDATLNPLMSTDDALGRCGEELMVMVYGYKRKDPSKRIHNRTWLDVLIKRIAKNLDYDKFIILLSGGGNDIADVNLEDFLNPTGHADGPVNRQTIDAAINQQLKGAFQQIFERVCSNFPTKQFHFIFHGYAYPPVNGRGVFMRMENSKNAFLHDMSPGPWLTPGFKARDIIERMQGEQIIGDFIDMFNDMLVSLQCSHPNGKLHYVDLRDITLKNDRDKGWCNELHFDAMTYSKASERFYKVICSLT